ncbi:TPA: exonuclease [Candidatus Poribacteria bacterium]|nr:exonuclease [Candidatus Poribacteria bacterium]
MEIYISTDIETNGPIPSHHSMLSFGSAAFFLDNTIVSTFSYNLDLLPNAKEYPPTMEWWKTQPEAWAACRENTVTPALAISDYLAWLESLPGTPVFVAHPVAFDYAFISWYLWEFTGEDPFKRNTLDVGSFAAAVLNQPVTKAQKPDMPEDWFDPDFEHNHIALDDAIGHAKLVCNMVQANLTVHSSSKIT